MRQRKRLFATREPQAVKPRFSIHQDHVVTLDYAIRDDDGKVLDTTEGHGVMSYVQGSGQMLPKLQEALEGHHSGDKITLRLLPQDAWGARDENKVQVLEKPLFEDVEEIEEGMQFEMMLDAGLRVVTVLDVDDNMISVDLNHPLAGKTLNIAATVVSVRPASPDEIESGQAR